MAWDKKTSKPFCNAIVWQCRRTTDFCQRLKKKGLERMIKRKTGLVLDPYFSGSKMQWILKNTPQAKTAQQKGRLAFGTIDSFLLWRLSGGKSFQTDVSNASRTMLMNLKTCDWDTDLLKIFSLRKETLPQINDSNALFGVTQNIPNLPDGIPISGIAGDQQAALFGQICFKAGEAKCTFGTGSFLLMNSGTKPVFSKSGLLTTLAWRLKGQEPVYALEGGAFICGAAVQWLRDQMLFIEKSSDIEKLALEVEDNGGVQVVPAFSGLGAPYWDPQARGVISGLSRGSNRAHIARATLEAMALQNVDILKATEKDLGKKLRKLRVDGGATANNLLMQMQSDYLGQSLIRPKMIETTSAGAAYLAGLGVGLWSSPKEVSKVWKVDQEYSCRMTKKRRDARLQLWSKAIRQSRIS